MSIQFIHNGNGKEAGVFIPIKEWKRLKKQYRGLETLEYVDKKNRLESNSKDAFILDNLFLSWPTDSICR